MIKYFPVYCNIIFVTISVALLFYNVIFIMIPLHYNVSYIKISFNYNVISDALLHSFCCVLM